VWVLIGCVGVQENGNRVEAGAESGGVVQREWSGVRLHGNRKGQRGIR